MGLPEWVEVREPATDQAIAAIEKALSITLPMDFKAFIKKHGFVTFRQDLPADGNDVTSARFDCQWKIRKDCNPYGDITHLMDPDQVIKATTYFTYIDPRPNEDEPQPLIPQGHIIIGGGFAQDYVLMHPASGAIHYFPQPDHWERWGTGNNIEIGYVAASFTEFLQNLRPNRLYDE